MQVKKSNINTPAINNYHDKKFAHPVSHLLSGEELKAQEINLLLKLATDIKKNPNFYHSALKHKKLIMIFEKLSFRTRLSFSLAIENLGGTALESISDTRKFEQPKDQIRVLNDYCDFVMIRTHADKDLKEMKRFATIPIINGLSELYHPCQILADLLSLQECFTKLEGLSIAYVGDGNNILHSLIMLAPQVGITVHYCCPPEHQPNEKIMSTYKRLFPDMIYAHSNTENAVKQVSAVYTDVWISMGFEEKKCEKDFHGFQVNEHLMSLAKPGAVFMHCMPMNRGKEVSANLPDKPYSIIFLQSKNRLYVQMALFLYLSGYN